MDQGESLESKQEKKQLIRRLLEKLILDDGDSESRIRDQPMMKGKAKNKWKEQTIRHTMPGDG
jgi:hypothetical protein